MALGFKSPEMGIAMTRKINRPCSGPRASFRFDTRTCATRGGRNKNTTTTTNIQMQSTKFILGLDPIEPFSIRDGRFGHRMCG